MPGENFLGGPLLATGPSSPRGSFAFGEAQDPFGFPHLLLCSLLPLPAKLFTSSPDPCPVTPPPRPVSGPCPTRREPHALLPPLFRLPAQRWRGLELCEWCSAGQSLPFLPVWGGGGGGGTHVLGFW